MDAPRPPSPSLHSPPSPTCRYNIHTVGFSRDIKKVKVDIGAKSKLLKEIDPMSPLADKPGKKTVYFVHMPSLIKHLGGEEKADERAMKAKMWRGAMLRMVERIRTKRCVERWEEYLDWFNNPPIHGKPTMQWEKLLKKYNEDRHVNKVLTIKSLLKKTKDSNFYPGLKGVPVRFCPISKMIDDRKKDIIVIDD